MCSTTLSCYPLLVPATRSRYSVATQSRYPSPLLSPSSLRCRRSKGPPSAFESFQITIDPAKYDMSLLATSGYITFDGAFECSQAQLDSLHKIAGLKPIFNDSLEPDYVKGTWRAQADLPRNIHEPIVTQLTVALQHVFPNKNISFSKECKVLERAAESSDLPAQLRHTDLPPVERVVNLCGLSHSALRCHQGLAAQQPAVSQYYTAVITCEQHDSLQVYGIAGNLERKFYSDVCPEAIDGGTQLSLSAGSLTVVAQNCVHGGDRALTI